MDELWKKFDEGELSHSGVHHLMAVHELHKEHGYARGIDIARHLDITRGSVSVTLSKLKAKGFLTEDNNKFYRLTAKGVNAVNSVLDRRRTIERFFREVLMVDGSRAQEDACKVEHLLSLETTGKLLSFMEFLLSSKPEASQFLAAYTHDIADMLPEQPPSITKTAH
ncbi:winged helix DNA-binding protein [candidate division GN15 bacterium]|nr:winged helix DNA-binding protein [candidate division GN15 bacterium]